MYKSLVSLMIILILSPLAVADELYEIKVTSAEEAQVLRNSALKPLLRVHRGYLILIPAEHASMLNELPLETTYIAGDLTRDNLQIDTRRGEIHSVQYPIVYENQGLRLVRANRSLLRHSREPLGLAPILTREVPIIFDAPVSTRGTLDIDLDSAIALVSQDSLSYLSHYMEDNFLFRVAGSTTNAYARNWQFSKFLDYGYDSVYLQDFVAEINGTNDHCKNVVAVKVGSELPNHHIVIGGHRDAVPDSPGGDDNGSGIVASMEIARLLATYDNRLTIIYVLFDAEEWGLHGAWHYANLARERGDSIVAMINMDMISDEDNHSEVYAFYGDTGSEIGDLFAQLADSLTGINLTADLVPAGGSSDHYPFDQNGYKVVFLHEHVFSSYYHSFRDSTSHMNFDYFKRVTMGALATAMAIDNTYETNPQVIFEFAEAPSDIQYPETETEIEFRAYGYAGADLIPGGINLHHSVDNGDWVTTPATATGDSSYVSNLPGLPCRSRVEYYFSAESHNAPTFVYPHDSSYISQASATAADTIYATDFGTSTGWSVSGDALAGAWEHGRPAGAWFGGAPRDDVDGNDSVFLTAQDYSIDVDDGFSKLVSPLIYNDGFDVQIEFSRWYSNHTQPVANEDVFDISLRTDTEVPVMQLGPVDNASGGWVNERFWLSDVTTPTNSFRMSFVVSDYGSDSNIEAALDAFRVIKYKCPPLIVTEEAPDWTVSTPISFQFVVAGGEIGTVITDKLGELVGTGMSLSTSGLLEGTPSQEGDIGFNLYAEDSLGDWDQRFFLFHINAYPTIATTALDDAVVGVAYTQSVNGSGGTGSLTWSDLHEDLVGTGLSIDSNGTLSGIPLAESEITFTLQVTDSVGASNTASMTVSVGPNYICGDINNSGEEPDVADLVYLVAYMFDSGPPPPVMASTDVNSDGNQADIADLVYLVAYMFQGGPDLCP